MDEVRFVAYDPHHGVVGVSTTYLARDGQLAMPLWHVRCFVAAPHRRSRLALELALATRDDLAARWADGRDPRAGGVMFEVQDPHLRRSATDAVWPRTNFAFVGATPDGMHRRVHYFPGARCPPPPVVGHGTT